MPRGRSRAKQYGSGGGGNGFLKSYLGAVGSEVSPEVTNPGDVDFNFKGDPSEAVGDPNAKVRFKPKNKFSNVISGGQGTRMANELNTQSVLDTIDREKNFADLKRDTEYKIPREMLSKEGIVPDDNSIIRFKEAVNAPRIAAAREQSLLSGEQAANQRGDTELAARKRNLTGEDQIAQAAFEAAKNKNLSQAALEQTPLDIANAKAAKEAEPFMLNSQRNKASLIPTSEGTSLYDVNLGRVTSKSPKSANQQVLREALGIQNPDAPKARPNNPAFPQKMDYDIVMVDGKPVKVPRKAPALQRNY